jgi:photosystem II stability/assembly factor-like uncharacterized protein
MTIASRMLASLAFGLLTACQDPCSWSEPQPIQLGIGVQLDAVVELDRYGLYQSPYTHLAVGAHGTVVALADSSATVFEVGGSDLHAIEIVESKWWVVGDEGMAAVSADFGESWTQVELAGSNANLRAITDAGVGLVVVGDDEVLVQRPDTTWTHATPPQGGWGDLRGVHWDGERVYAVGLEGVVWSAANPTKTWVAEDVGVDVDLNAIGEIEDWHPFDEIGSFAVVGAEGTYLTHRRVAGWNRETSGTSEDLIAYSQGVVASAEGTLFKAESDGSLTPLTEFPGTRNLDYRTYGYEVLLVGDNGRAATVYTCD